MIVGANTSGMMMRRAARRIPVSVAVLLLLLAPPEAAGPLARAQEEQRPGRQAPAGPSQSPPGPTGGRGIGVLGVEGTPVLAATALLAIVGLGAVLGSRLRPLGAGGELRVVGRAQLSGRHAVYLLRVADRTLIVGVGPQGAPSLLGEVEHAATTAGTAGPEPASAVPVPHLDPGRPGVSAGGGA